MSSNNFAYNAEVQSLEPIVRILESGIRDEALTGGVLLVSKGGELVARLARGTKLPDADDAASPAAAMEFGTVFDLGAITSSICTVSVLMRLISAGKLDVGDRASRILQTLGVGPKAAVTVAHLLSHSSGFPSGVSVYDDLVKANSSTRLGILTSSSGAKQYAYNHFVKLPLKFEPGAKQLVSDANFILLGQICEVLSGLPLDKTFHRLVAAPLQLKSLSFIDLTLIRRKNLEPVVEMFAPSGRCSKRDRLVAGEVWDENCSVMGGVAGHSGLFGIAQEVHAWAVEMLEGYKGKSSVFDQKTVKTFWDPSEIGIKAGLKLGFDATSKENGFVDAKLAPEAVTTSTPLGSSVFIDPQRDLVVVFLTNAGFSAHANRRFLALRSEIHSTLLDAS